MLWYSLEAPHRGASNEYPQRMLSRRNKKKIFICCPLLARPLEDEMSFRCYQKLIVLLDLEITDILMAYV